MRELKRPAPFADPFPTEPDGEGAINGSGNLFQLLRIEVDHHQPRNCSQSTDAAEHKPGSSSHKPRPYSPELLQRQQRMELDGSPPPARRERHAWRELFIEDDVIPQARGNPDEKPSSQDPEPQFDHDLRREHDRDERDYAETHQASEDQQQFKHENDCTGIRL